MAGRVRRIVSAAKRLGLNRRKSKNDRRGHAMLARYEQLILPSLDAKSGEYVYEKRWVNERAPHQKKREIVEKNIRAKERINFPTQITRQGNFIKKVDYYWVTTDRRQNKKRKKK